MLIFLLASFLMGCTANNVDDSTAVNLHQSASVTDADDDAPEWVQKEKTDSRLFSGLNLDGIGDLDDEVYVSIYHFGEYDDNITVLQIHLGTGETIAKIFPVFGAYTLQTGHLFSEEKEAIILEIEVPGSNYGAANVFVLDVCAAEIDPVPSVVTRLDSTVDSAIAGTDNTLSDFGEITNGTTVVDVEDFPLQGLMIYFTGANGQWRELYELLFWSDSGWSTKSEMF